MSEYAVETNALTKAFPMREENEEKKKEKVLRKVVDSVDLELPKGQFTALLGPNGAGKTTLIKMLVTLLLPTSGSAKVNGYDIIKEPAQVRASIGHMHGETGGRSLYWRLTGRDNLRFFAFMQDVPIKVGRERIDALLDYFGLAKDADRGVKEYSTGMKVRLMLARTLLHNPPILLLDEPTIGLDAEGAVETRDFLKTLNKELGKTILFTSHVMSEVEQLCERIVIINKGRIISDTTPDNLRFLTRDVRSIEVRFLGTAPDRVSQILKEKLDCVQAITKNESHSGHSSVTATISCEESDAIPLIARTLSNEHVKVIGIQATEPTLEEAFIKLVKSYEKEDNKRERPNS
ncbi:MAG: ABC transporter ATP-binding protein [Promethearchaeati archaeon SRVP18_Atabeyarchaeia-1]